MPQTLTVDDAKDWLFMMSPERAHHASTLYEYISQLESALKFADKNGYLLNNCRILAEKYANAPADEEEE